jgi:hypothetical protein
MATVKATVEYGTGHPLKAPICREEYFQRSRIQPIRAVLPTPTNQERVG